MKRMSRVLALTLAVVLVVSLVGCGAKKADTPVSSTPAPATATPAPATATPAPATATPAPATATPSEEPAADDGPIGVMEYTGARTPIAPEDLKGVWTILAWDLTTGGMYTTVAEACYVFTDDTLDYTTFNSSQTHCSYEFKDPTTIHIVDLKAGAYDKDWEVWYNDDGQLVFVDNEKFLAYFCERSANQSLLEKFENAAPADDQPAPADQQPADQQPADDQPAGDPWANEEPQAGKTPISFAELQGEWDVPHMNMGMEFPSPGWKITVSETELNFISDAGAVTSKNSIKQQSLYKFELADLLAGAYVVVWEIYRDDATGEVVMHDLVTTYTYYCTR